MLRPLNHFEPPADKLRIESSGAKAHFNQWLILQWSFIECKDAAQFEVLKNIDLRDKIKTAARVLNA